MKNTDDVRRRVAREVLGVSEQPLAAERDALARLYAVAQQCASRDGRREDCLELILSTAIAFTKADRGNVQIYDEASRSLTIAVHKGFPQRFLDFFREVGTGEGAACGTAFAGNGRVVVEDVTNSAIFVGQPSLAVLLDAGIRAVQSTPLTSSSGQVLGMVSTHFDRPHRPSERELQYLDLLARHAADYLERKQGEERLRAALAGLQVDVDQRKQAERALQEANRQKDEFLAMLSHELRNPLAAIRNAVAAASRDASYRDAAVAIVERQTDQLARLVDDLLDVTRITQGRIALRREPITLQAVLARAVEATKFQSDARGHTMTVDLQRDDVVVDGDATRLEQVFVNVLSNACKYTPRGGRVSISLSTVDGYAVTRIRDSGIGIAPELLVHVFVLFTQAERSLDRAQGGLGIGLTIASRLVELHDGRIEAFSEGTGKGSEFVIALPRLAEALRPNPTANGIRDAPKIRSRVLIVEDNADAAESLRRLLELLGHQVDVARNGRDGLAAARASAPDVMLIDIGLPGIDGYELARRVRREPTLADRTLIALTGYGRDEDKAAALAAGFDHHLVKPVEPGDLDTLLRTVGRGARNRPTETVPARGTAR